LNIFLTDNLSKYKPNSITTFVDRRYNNGDSYKILGFTLIKNTEPNYWYNLENTLKREHRYNFRKEVLINEGFDSNKSEFQIMEERGYLRIYDCGSLKLEMAITN